MMLTKELLADYLRIAACEEGIISSPEEAKELDGKLRSLDRETFEAVLRSRYQSLKDMATGKKERGLFDAQCYGSQANTIDGIIRALPSILAA
jgi:hypothetical protein